MKEVGSLWLLNRWSRQCKERTVARMEGLLLIVVLTSVFSVHVGIDIPIQADFDFEKMEGKWYPIALALIQGSPSTPDPIYQELIPSENGDLLVKIIKMKEEKCKARYTLLYHSGEPGKFFNRDNSTTLRMVEVNYDSYYILHVDTQDVLALHLYARKWDGIEELKEKFQTMATSLEFSADLTKFLSEQTSCQD